MIGASPRSNRAPVRRVVPVTDTRVDAGSIVGFACSTLGVRGCSAGVIAPGLYPLLRSGQINGLIGGLRGAAEYESLVGKKGRAVAGMDAQSATHFAIIVLVAMCNLFYFSLRRQQGGRQR